MELNKVFSKYFNSVAPECGKVNTEICERCGGACCQAMGCHISPFNLKEITVESIINLIDESQCISIDWWNGNPLTDETDGYKAFYLRIKNKGSKVIDPAFRGVCSILTDIGCPLSFEYRPKGARDLIPSNGECFAGYTKQQAAIDWLPYHDIMTEVYDYYFEKGDVTNSMTMAMTVFGDLFAMLGIEDE